MKHTLDNQDGAGRKFTASGSMIYLVEELGDARLRATQLKEFVAEVLDLINKSDKKDHFYEVAAHLIQGIPDTLFKLDKALDAAAMAAAKMDYEEVKQGLKPEKADELERALEDVRLRYLDRRSAEMDAKTTAEVLDKFAGILEAGGRVPTHDMLALVSRLERGAKKASSSVSIADVKRIKPGDEKVINGWVVFRMDRETWKVHRVGDKIDGSSTSVWDEDPEGLADWLTETGLKKASAEFFREAAESLRTTVNPSRLELAQNLRRVLADTLSAQDAGLVAGAGEDFKRENPEISDADVEKIDQMHARHKDVVKDKHAGAGEEFQKVNTKITDEQVQEINRMHEKHKDLLKKAVLESYDAEMMDPMFSAEFVIQAFNDAYMASRVAYTSAMRGNDRVAAQNGL